jgi:hypothetical protein
VNLEPASRHELMQLVGERQDAVRHFLTWAQLCEEKGQSNLLVQRPDIPEAREAVVLYPEPWWGVTVYTCFGSLNSTRRLRESFEEPLPSPVAEDALAATEFTYPRVGGHRIQQGLAGAKKALVAACDSANLICDVLHQDATFDERYGLLRDARLSRWGRTTCFDLILRAGALGVGGRRYAPDFAYLQGSTGPSAGFKLVWGRAVNADTAPWCEGVLQAWSAHWNDVAHTVGIEWTGVPYRPADFENALCVYQH